MKRLRPSEQRQLWSAGTLEGDPDTATPPPKSLTNQNTKSEKPWKRDGKADNVTQAESTKMQNRTVECVEERTVEEIQDKSHG